jgi:hypothetical protein
MPGGPFFVFGQSGTLAEMKQILAASLLVLASCQREDRPQAPTAEESDRLNDAETMLNGLANEEGPEDFAPGPSNRSN